MKSPLKYRIIELLVKDTGNFYSISDIAKKLNTAYSHTHLFIQQLATENIIQIKKVGNTSVCILNTSEPLTLSHLSLLSYKKTQEWKTSHPQSERLFEKVNIVKDNTHSIILCGNKIIIITPEKITGADFTIFKNRTIINQYQLLANKQYYKGCIILHGAEKFWSLMTQ